MNRWNRRLFLRRLGFGTATVMGLRLSARRQNGGAHPTVPLTAQGTVTRIADLLIETPRDRIFERLADEIRAGASHLDVMGGVLLAGVREIKPRPVGFKLHAVMMTGSALDLAQQADPSERWLPVLWNADDFKRSQERDRQEGDWTLPEPPPIAALAKEQARQALVAALETWDEGRVDTAVTALFPHLSLDDFFEVLWPYGARCFADIGHKAIYTAQAYRALRQVGWSTCGFAVMRSLANSLLADGYNLLQ